jgi:predicted MPP superfamily phosphohydrolase
LQVYTTYGTGTWGPPLRLGTQPEIVLITFVS